MKLFASLFSALLFCLPLLVQAQPGANASKLLTPAELENEIWYNSIEEAMKNPEKVYKLNLSKKKLKTFPLEILLFKNLQHLNLSSNSLDTLPQEIKAFKNLQVLNLYSNSLRRLPEDIGDLNNLRELYLSRNYLYTFPVAIRGLQNLSVMDVTFNNFTENEIKYARKYLPRCIVKYEN
jgi:Leucine-rich repeat (LRR) protein